MPRNEDRPLSAEEQRFIRHYVRERDVEMAERKARLKTGEGMRMYRRVHVRGDIDRRIQVIELEQAKIDARDIERRDQITQDYLDGELRKLIDLAPEIYGPLKLKAVMAGYVVRGKIRQGNTIVLDQAKEQNSASVNIYQSVFERRHADDAQAAADQLVEQQIVRVPRPPVPPSPTASPAQPAASQSLPQSASSPKAAAQRPRTVIRAY